MPWFACHRPAQQITEHLTKHQQCRSSCTCCHSLHCIIHTQHQACSSAQVSVPIRHGHFASHLAQTSFWSQRPDGAGQPKWFCLHQQRVQPHLPPHSSVHHHSQHYVAGANWTIPNDVSVEQRRSMMLLYGNRERLFRRWQGSWLPMTIPSFPYLLSRLRPA